MIRFRLLFVFTFFIGVLSAQQEDLAFYCDAMANAQEGNHRQFAAEKFETLFKTALKEESSFYNAFSECKWISIKAPEIQNFRIITWQVQEEEGKYVYHGLIQMADGKIFDLEDHAREMGDIDYDEMSQDDWFGALYYNILESGSKDDMYYLLFGYNGWTEKVHKKIIDVLYFKNDKPEFGKAVFAIKDSDGSERLKYRILLDYDGTANVNCNYNDGLEMIIHDYVTARTGFSPDGEIRKIPDGTYVAYEYKKNKWHQIEKLENQVTKPEDIFFQPKPSEEGDKRDILGRPKKN